MRRPAGVRPTVLSGSATKLSCPMGEWEETGHWDPISCRGISKSPSLFSRVTFLERPNLWGHKIWPG